MINTKNNTKPIALLKFEGFNAAFEQMLAIPAPSYAAAYEMVEAIHEREFGFRKYMHYDSFRCVRGRKLRVKKAKKNGTKYQ